MSERTACLADFSSITSPIAIPATADRSGTPASIIASDPPHADLDPDRPHLVEAPAVEPQAALEHLVAQHLLLELLEDLFRFELALHLALGQRGDELVEDLVDAVVVFELAANPHGLGQRDEHLLLDLAVEVMPDLLLRDLHLPAAGLARQIIDRGDDPADRRVRCLERLDDLLLAD